jgi:hypothetical protein
MVGAEVIVGDAKSVEPDTWPGAHALMETARMTSTRIEKRFIILLPY